MNARPAAAARAVAPAVWLMAVGFTCAAAMSVKWTALATPGMIALECFFGAAFLARPLPIMDMLEVGLYLVVGYALPFAAHFALLPNSGEGDAFLPLSYQAALVDSPHYDAAAPAPGFVEKFIHLNTEMFRANAGITTRHAWESTWKSWPLDQRGILYYTGHDAASGQPAAVYLIGNPAVLWFATLAAAVFAVVLLLQARYREPDRCARMRVWLCCSCCCWLQ